MFALQFCCLYEVSLKAGHMFYKHCTIADDTPVTDKRPLSLLFGFQTDFANMVDIGFLINLGI